MPYAIWNVVSIPRHIKDNCEFSLSNCWIWYIDSLYILGIHESIRDDCANVASMSSEKCSHSKLMVIT